VLDFIPLAGAGRQVADDDVKAEFVGQLLEFAFPQPDPRAVAAPAIGGDQQSGCLGIARPTDGEPPLADTVHREGGRVMVDADTHPPGVRGQIIDPVGHRAVELLDQKVMDPDLFRVSLGAIFAPVVAKIPTGHVWMVPGSQGFFHVSASKTNCSHVYGLEARRKTAAPDGFRGSRSDQARGGRVAP